jgi:hypothetical protein
LAGFQVIIYGRFWVITEDQGREAQDSFSCQRQVEMSYSAK